VSKRANFIIKYFLNYSSVAIIILHAAQSMRTGLKNKKKCALLRTRAWRAVNASLSLETTTESSLGNNLFLLLPASLMLVYSSRASSDGLIVRVTTNMCLQNLSFPTKYTIIVIRVQVSVYTCFLNNFVLSNHLQVINRLFSKFYSHFNTINKSKLLCLKWQTILFWYVL